MRNLTELKLGPKIQALVDRCCTVCYPGCCGLGAYNLTPLQIASYFYRDPNEEVLECAFEPYRDELRELLRVGDELSPDENGLICSIEGLNQCFSRQALETFVCRLWRSLELAPKVLRYSQQLEEYDARETELKAIRAKLQTQ